MFHVDHTVHSDTAVGEMKSINSETTLSAIAGSTMPDDRAHSSTSKSSGDDDDDDGGSTTDNDDDAKQGRSGSNIEKKYLINAKDIVKGKKLGEGSAIDYFDLVALSTHALTFVSQCIRCRVQSIEKNTTSLCARV